MLVAVAALAGCLPGPWDYRPESRPAFRGITASVYAVADRPVENACFEKLYQLDEASTEAFPFYDADSVTITGNFSDGAGTRLLTRHPKTPNCFVGPSGSRFVRGESYALRARFTWDSAGATVTSVLTATARVPGDFGIVDTAYAPSLASAGAALDNITDSATFLHLPPVPRAKFLERYGDTLLALQGNAPGLASWELANGIRLRKDLTEWLQEDLVTYRRGDSLYYLSAQSNLSNLSHFFKARRDAAVKGVLISQRFDTLGSRPTTSFDSLFGIAPDTASFYYPGDHRRLIFYGDYRNPDGRHVFDSLGFVNAWFWSGRNRLYFYGAEAIYSDFQTAREEQSGNTKIVLPTNVTGGQGFFAGMVVDSFDVNIRLDGSTQSFTYAAARAAACRDKGWFSTRDCVGYYPAYCAANGWTTADCRVDAMSRAMDPVDSLTLPAALRDSARFWATWNPALTLESQRRYCIDENYRTDVPACAGVRAECENTASGNACQLILWKHCQLNYWQGPECVEGAKSYCRAKRDVARTMCREVPEF
jgi:hypothetical protein